MAAHAHAHDGKFANLFIGDHLAEADFVLQPVNHLAGLEQIGLVHGEGNIGGWGGQVVAGVLDDHVHIDVGVGDGFENQRGHPGPVGHLHQGEFGLVFVERNAADDDAFHAGGFFFHKGSWVVIEAGADFKNDAEFFGEFDRAGLHDLGAQPGQFEHFIVGNLGQLAGAGNNARVGGIDAVHVGVNLAEAGLEGGGQGDGGEVRSAPAPGW